MTSLNTGSAVYHGVQGFYWRRPDFTFVSASGNGAAAITAAWSDIQEQLAAANTSKASDLCLPSNKHITTSELSLRLSAEASENTTYCVRELHDSAHPDRVLGLISSKATATRDGSSLDLNSWAELFVLCETRLLPPAENASDESDATMAERITDIFDRYLRNVVPHDQWSKGRSYFEARVLDFVTRRLPIELCLPAFPCKSPSEDKTTSTLPDKAEYLALKTLDEFAARVGDIYSPGAIVLIVSDGHVFSDLLEVRDDNVDIYGEALKDMYYSMKSSTNGHIHFTSLTEIFFGNQAVTSLFQAPWIADFPITHPIPSDLSTNAERCRKLMLALGQNDKAVLRSLITSAHPPTLGLYRGLSRFMLDDLAHSAAFTNLSMSKRKKISSAVASEMIVRNCAYSNLVELLFPSHLRLSIHAHDNSGPKFAVRLLAAVAVEDLETRDAQILLDNYHTPTPWHNCLAYVAGEPRPYLIKARAAHDAIAKGYLRGEWTETPEGGFFALRKAEDEEVVVEEKAAPVPITVAIPESPVALPVEEVLLSAVERPVPVVVRYWPALAGVAPLVYLPVRCAVACAAMVGDVCKSWVRV